MGRGCRINYVRPGSPAENVGLRIGDFVMRIDSQTIKDFKDLSATVASAGSSLEIEVLRKGQPQLFKIALPPPGRNLPRLGVSCEDAPPANADPVTVSSASLVSTDCPFSIKPTGQLVRLSLKDGRSFEGKLLKCGAEVNLRSGIIFRTFAVEKIAAITAK